MRNVTLAFEEMDVSREDIILQRSSAESTFDGEFQKLLVMESFLTAVREGGMSQSMIDLANSYGPQVALPSCEDSLSGEVYSSREICMIAEENWMIGVGSALASFSAAVFVPINAIRTLDITFTKTIQEASSGIGKMVGSVHSKVTKDQAKLILNGMEAAAAIAILYYSGIGGAVVKAAKSPAFAESYIGGFITKITQFKWPFGSFKAGVNKTGKAFVDFVDDTREAMYPHLRSGFRRTRSAGGLSNGRLYDPADPVWEADVIPEFSERAQAAVESIASRLKTAVTDGVSSFYRQFNGVIVKPIAEKTRDLGFDAAGRTGSVAAGRIVTFAMRSLASFGLMVIARFAYRVLHQGVTLLRNLIKSLYHEAKAKIESAAA